MGEFLKDPVKTDLVEDGLDRVREAAKFLGLSIAKVYLLMEDGSIPYVKIGKSRRIPHRGLVMFAADHLVAR